MTTQLAPNPVFRATDAFGLPLYLGQLGTFVAGTNTPQVTYKDSAGIATNTNPVILNPRGECNLWLDPTKSYKLVLSDALGNLIWTVDNVTIGNANPTYNIIPTVDNLFTLGSTSFSWANVYIGPNHAPVFDVTTGNIGYYARTSAEIALGITPTNFSFPAYPYVDPRRYGADPTGVADSTAAMQNAINVAYRVKGVVWIGNGCNFSVGALTLTMTGNHGNDGFHIMGAEVNGSQLSQRGTPGTILTINGTGTAGNPGETPMLLENFTINLSGANTDAIKLYNCSLFVLRRIYMFGHNHGIYLSSSLTGVIEECFIESGTFGVFCRADGANPVPVNLIRIQDCGIHFNTSWGVDYDQGSALQMTGNDMEGNGTALNVNTGAVRIGPQINPFTGFGIAHILLANNWLEANNGISIRIESPTAGQITNICIRDSHIISADSGRAIFCFGAGKLLISQCSSITPGDTYNLTAASVILDQISVNSLVDSGVVSPHYRDITTGSGNQRTGRVSTYTATLTNATGTPTGSVTVIQEGAAFRLIFPAITGASTATSDPSFSGLPAALIPSVSRAFVARAMDNSAELYATMVVASGTGTITLSKPVGTFTAAGNKGVLTFSTPWIDL